MEGVWTHLRKKQFGYRFLRKYSVDQFVIDFYCPKLKLALEIDGSVHEEPDNKEYDIKRQEFLETFGIKLIRLTNDEINGNPNKAFNKIEKKIKEIEITSSKTQKRTAQAQ